MLIFVFWVIFAGLVSVYADRKGRSGAGFFFLSLFLSPLIGFVIAAVVEPKKQKVAERSGMKKCPDCAEFVQGEARVCRFCGHRFDADVVLGQVSPTAPAATTDGRVIEPQIRKSDPGKWLVICGGAISIVILLAGVYSSLSDSRDRDRAKAIGSLRTIATANVTYSGSSGGYAPSLDNLSSSQLLDADAYSRLGVAYWADGSHYVARIHVGSETFCIDETQTVRNEDDSATKSSCRGAAVQ